MIAKIFVINSKGDAVEIQNSTEGHLSTPARARVNHDNLNFNPHDLIFITGIAGLSNYRLLETIESKELSDYLFNKINEKLREKIELYNQRAAAKKMNDDGFLDEPLSDLKRKLKEEYHEISILDLIEEYKEAT